MDCLFCKIIGGEISADVIFEDDYVVVFNDIHPQAPNHFLIIPKKHIHNIASVTNEDQQLLGHMLLIAKDIAIKKDISESGYRLVFNCNDDGGQSVDHLHLHLLAGRRMSWPPG